jgi:hypothetical protein
MNRNQQNQVNDLTLFQREKYGAGALAATVLACLIAPSCTETAGSKQTTPGPLAVKLVEKLSMPAVADVNLVEDAKRDSTVKAQTLAMNTKDEMIIDSGLYRTLVKGRDSSETKVSLVAKWIREEPTAADQLLNSLLKRHDEIEGLLRAGDPQGRATLRKTQVNKGLSNYFEKTERPDISSWTPEKKAELLLALYQKIAIMAKL